MRSDIVAVAYWYTQENWTCFGILGAMEIDWQVRVESFCFETLK